MTLKPTKLAFTIWFLAMCAAGLAAGVTSIAGWIILGGLALLPLIFMLPLWSGPPQTMSESIRDARR